MGFGPSLCEYFTNTEDSFQALRVGFPLSLTDVSKIVTNKAETYGLNQKMRFNFNDLGYPYQLARDVLLEILPAFESNPSKQLTYLEFR